MVQIRRPPPLSPAPNPVFATIARSTELLRLYDTNSRYPYALFRNFGPLERYDHQRETFRWQNLEDPERAVCYCAERLSACMVEVCGDKTIVADHYDIITIEAANDLSLLDLRGTAAMRAGIPAAVPAISDRIYTQEWARYFYLETSVYGSDTAGIIYPGAHNGEDCIVLWDRAMAIVRQIDRNPITDREREVRQIAQDQGLTVSF